jgi:hypothetical protein
MEVGTTQVSSSLLGLRGPGGGGLDDDDELWRRVVVTMEDVDPLNPEAIGERTPNKLKGGGDSAENVYWGTATFQLRGLNNGDLRFAVVSDNDAIVLAFVASACLPTATAINDEARLTPQRLHMIKDIQRTRAVVRGTLAAIVVDRDDVCACRGYLLSFSQNRTDWTVLSDKLNFYFSL